MKKYYLSVFVLLIFLASCSSLSKTAVPTATAAPKGPYDGQWEGSGKTKDGETFTVLFTISNSAVTSIQYSFGKPGNIPCSDIGYLRINESDQPHIQKNSFTSILGPDLNMSAVFDSESSASGQLSGTLINHRGSLCSTAFEVNWYALKQVVSTSPSPPSQSTTPRAHPIEILIQILVFGFSNGAVLALNAIGVTIIYSTVRTFNLAHGDVFALTTVVVTSLVNSIGIQRNWSLPQLVGALGMVFSAAVFAGMVLSVGVNELAFKPFRGYSNLAPLIATLGLSFILYQVALVWRTFQASWIPGEHRSVPGTLEVPTDGIPSLLPEINLVKAFHLPLNVIIRFSDVFVLLMAIAFVALATWFLQRSRTGRAIRAYSQNPDLAQILGVNVNQTIRRAFGFGGALAGAAAFIFAIYYGRPFGVHGAQSGLLAFTAALLGGIGSPTGALISGLLMGVVSSLSDYYLSARWTSVLLLALLVGLLAWRPAGLASSDSQEFASIRDSVILTTPGKGKGSSRWLILLTILLGALPIMLQILGLSGGTILRTIAIFMILSLGLNLALGIAGLLDFGFALSYAVGAYATAILSAHIGFVPALIISIAAASLIGIIKGGLAWRLRGDYLAVATLALGLLGRQIIINLGSLTGGANGLGNFPPPSLFDLHLNSPIEKYYLVFGALLVAIWLNQRILLSHLGRTWIASSEDEVASTSVGVNVTQARLWAFVFSAALAGLAGSLFASTFSFVNPDMLAFQSTSLVLTMVILGGARGIPGAMLGAATIVLFDKVAIPQLAGLIAIVWPKNFFIGSAPDIRGANFFNFGIALYLTVLLRARKKPEPQLENGLTSEQLQVQDAEH